MFFIVVSSLENRKRWSFAVKGFRCQWDRVASRENTCDPSSCRYPVHLYRLDLACFTFLWIITTLGRAFTTTQFSGSRDGICALQPWSAV